MAQGVRLPISRDSWATVVDAMGDSDDPTLRAFAKRIWDTGKHHAGTSNAMLFVWDNRPKDDSGLP